MTPHKLPIFFAPLQGFTDAAYRKAHHAVCGGIEAYYAPFLRLEHGELRRRDVRDVSPLMQGEPEGGLLIPQVIAADVEEFPATCQIKEVLCGGENYGSTRPYYEREKKLSDQCRKYNVSFEFIEIGTIFVMESKTYHIPDKRIQSLQAYKSGVSYNGKDIDFKLTSPEIGFVEKEAYTPFFREHCETYGSRMTSNGCSKCANCE